jgi:capsule polysaccharide export protein KpsE/RkpR
MGDEPENLVLQLLRGLRSDMVKLDAKLDQTKAELKAELTAEINSLRADVASDMSTLQKQTGEQIEGLRQTVVQYHSSVVGHGFLISDLEARVRRVERHLELPPLVEV